MSTPKPTDPSSALSSPLYTEQIDHLYQDMKKLVNSFSTTEKDGADDPVKSNERSLACISNLQSISACIDMLRSLEPSLDFSLAKFADEEEMGSTGEIVEEPVMDGEQGHETETNSKSTASIEVEDFDAYRSSWELPRRPAKKFEDMKGRLKVTIEAYAPSGTITGHVFFTPQKCNITKDICYLGDSAVEVTVAWSLLPLPKKS